VTSSFMAARGDSLRLLTLLVAALLGSVELTAAPVISEFLASNAGSHTDGDGNPSDWIEIWNDSNAPLPLAGWSLTDDPDELKRWPFPAFTLPPNGRFLVYASGQITADYADAEGGAHANFKISSGSGGFLALVHADGQIVHAYDDYPEQRTDISYGLDPAGVPVFFLTPTPGDPNSDDTIVGFVADTKFSVDRGIFTATVSVIIATETEGAAIRYTTDGSAPTLESGHDYPGGVGILIETTTILRAAAFKEGHQPSNVDTHSYVFPVAVVDQPERPEGFPTSWSGWDYEMDQDPDDLPLIAGDESLSPESSKAVIAESLRALPTMSIVMNVDDLFARPNGIYFNTQGRGDRWERAASMEIIHSDGQLADYQIDCGIRMQGFTSRDPSRNPKHSLRLVFRKAYGDAKMRYPIFGEDAAREFDTIVLRSNAQDAWVYDSTGNRVGQFVRDQWNREAQQRMGRPAAHGMWVHLYLNGLYWGVYNPTERPDASFMASYFGSNPEDYDILKNHEEVIDGTRAAYRELLGLVQRNASSFSSGYNDFTSDASYQAVQGNGADGSPDADLPDYVDVPSLIDYMIHNMYSAAQDWPGNNYIGRLRVPDGTGFHFFSWDNEHGMKGSVRENRTTPHSRDNDSPTKFHHPLTKNSEYRLLFADHLHRAIVAEGGVLFVDPENPDWDPEHPERNEPAGLWMKITGSIQQALIAESARWGDYRRSTPYTVHKDFGDLRSRLLRTWFPDRSANLLEQFRARDLYPDIEAPSFNQQGGNIPEGFGVVLTSESPGTMYYTIDGSDPRLPGGELASTAQIFEGGISQVSYLVGGRFESASTWNYLDTGAYLDGTNWTSAVFDDSAWKTGLPEFGYGDRDETTQIEFGDDPFEKHITTYFRAAIDVADAPRVQKLAASIKHDDGAIVYLNGTEVYRGNLPEGVVAFDTRANQKGDERAYFDISPDPAGLVSGTNVVAVEIHQLHGGDSDISFDFELTGEVLKETADVIEIANATRLRARVLGSEGEWSALNEALFVVGEQPTAENLAISEIMYHPQNNADAEFIEILNIGSEFVDLTGLRLAGGVFFVFSRGNKPSLAPGERFLVVKDKAAMEAVYGASVLASVAGEFQYGTGLANSGEAVRIEDALGGVIHSITFDDKSPWPEEADGDGPSLVLVNPAGGGDLSDGRNWKPSESSGGTPGSGIIAMTTYASWQQANGVGDPERDDDGDRLSNLLEYAAGTDPKFADPTGIEFDVRLIRDKEGSRIVEVSFVRNALAADLRYTLEQANDLVEWSDATGIFGQPTITHFGEGMEILTYQAGELGTTASGLVRMRVELVGQ
jgi:hypothetical protein